MLDYNVVTQLGVAGISLFIVWMMLRWFMETIHRKDNKIEELVNNFQRHIELCNTNFIKNSQHVVKSVNQQIKTLEKLNRGLDNQTTMIAQILQSSDVAEEAKKFMEDFRSGRIGLSTKLEETNGS